MNKTVVISTNGNKNYLFFWPIVTWAWMKLGWDVMIMNTTDAPLWNNFTAHHHFEKKLTEVPVNASLFTVYKEETITQVSRLYAANDLDWRRDALLMTADVDMLPLSDYWKPDPDEITCYGRDLTDYHYPICYIAMKAWRWAEVMQLSGSNFVDICHDLQRMPRATSEKWEEWWQVDQDLITERLKNFSVTRVDRGVAPNSHYPLGRIDRGSWDLTLNQEKRIDAHLLRPGFLPENFEKIISLIKQCYGVDESDVKWMRDYRSEFINAKQYG